ncbi:MAG: enoyl-CoA hydratase/isomerase family protein [Candidatus Kapaibacteriota bacterium]
MNGFVRKEIVNSVGIVSFYHPKSNSLPSNLLKEMEIAINELSEKEAAKVILIKSEGDRAFCAGASFEELVSLKDFQTAKAFFSGFGKVINAIRRASKLVVARVHGKVVGGGLGLVSACDYVVALKTASVRLSEFSIAIGPFVISHALERKIGKSAFTQMTIDTQWYSAHWCLEKGLYNKIFDTNQDMDNYLTDFLDTLVKRSSKTQYELKRLFWEGTEDWDKLLEDKAEITARLALDEYAQKAIHSLLK